MFKSSEVLNQLSEEYDAFMSNLSTTNGKEALRAEAYVESGQHLLQKIRAQGRYLDNPILRDRFSQMARDINLRLFELTGEYFPARLESLEEEESNKLVVSNVSDKLVIGDLSAHNVEIYYTHQAPAPSIPLQRPPRVEHFINRETELAQLLNDLQPGRVVTLIGTGGIGKSALAAEAVWRLAPDNEPPEPFPDGIIFHSFYNQPQVVRAFENIARAFGQEAQPTPHEAARRALIRRQALLVLDGTENADNLRQLLTIASGCGVLITTRRRTDAAGSWVDISPLPLNEAQQLLQAWGKTQVRDQAAGQQICELVGGLPLAVCLVGRYLYQTGETASEYLEWLKATPMEALEQGDFSQMSIRLLLKRSVNQVSESAQQVLAIAGLLAPAPFSWQIIKAGLHMSARQVRRILGELVSYSLLIRPSDRYEVSHPLIHTYGGEMPVPSEVVTRVVSYYTQLADEQSQQGPTGYAILDAERPHFLRLLDTCLASQDWEAVKTLVWAIDNYLDIQGHWTERVTFLEAGLVAERALGLQKDEGAFLGKLGNTYHALGEVEKALECYEKALVIQQQIGDVIGEADTLDNLGNIYRDLGEVEQAISCYQQALKIQQTLGNRLGESNTLGNLGNAYVALGEVAPAISYYQQALGIQREIGQPRASDSILGNLGTIYQKLGQISQAIKSYQQAVAISRQVGNRHAEGAELINLGVAYHDLGKLEKAYHYYQQALAIYQAIGDQRGETTSLHNLSELYQIEGKSPLAHSLYQQALTTSSNLLTLSAQ